jgi:hypothetical protein
MDRINQSHSQRTPPTAKKTRAQANSADPLPKGHPFADPSFLDEPSFYAPTPIVEQPSLFSVAEVQTATYTTERVEVLTMAAPALTAWKQRVFDYQQQVQNGSQISQPSLFEFATAAPHAAAQVDTLDPFKLPQQNTEFWRWKASDTGVSALYFVIDYTLPLLLYVGETVKSNQRWKGEHDCKRYLLNYRQSHYQNQLPSQLGIAFWANAPVATRQRQKLESDLIYKWRSPFNKENWEFWGTPFVGGKG